MGGLLPLLRRGAVSTDDFLRATRGDFKRMALGLLGEYRRRGPRFALPTDVAEEDVANRMRLIALRCVGKWDPTRGTTLECYVTFTTYSKARRWIDERRGAKREKAGSQPSCFPLLLADLFAPGEEDERDVERVSNFVGALDEGPRPGQHEAAEAAALLARLRDAGFDLGDGTVEGAVEVFEASKRLRLLARQVIGGGKAERGAVLQ